MLKSAIALAFIASISVANAQEATQPVPVPAEACVPSDKLLQMHKERWNEVPIIGGDAGSNGFLLFTSPNGETWTIVLARPDGQSCIVLSGTGLLRVSLGQDV